MPVTWNPADKNANITLTNSNKTASLSAAAFNWVRATDFKSSGKFYFEVLIGAGAPISGQPIGVGNSSATLNGSPGTSANQTFLYRSTGAALVGTTVAFTGATFGANSVVGFAIDLDGLKAYVSVNGTWQNSANPSAGTGGVTIPAHTVAAYGSPRGSATSTHTLRAKAADFSYSVPTGFSAYEELEAITGALTVTETGADLFAASGAVDWSPVTGALAATETGSDVAAGTGTVAWTALSGSLAATEAGSDVFAASGAVGWPALSGALAATETSSDALAAIGAVDWPELTGAFAAEEDGADAFEASGSVADDAITGTLTVQEAEADLFAATGVVGYPGNIGTLDAIEDGLDGFDAIGVIGGASITGTQAAVEQGADTFAGSGKVVWSTIGGSWTARREVTGDVRSGELTIVGTARSTGMPIAGALRSSAITVSSGPWIEQRKIAG